MRIAIIGGGLAGLATAFRLRGLSLTSGREIAVTVFEQGSRFGGAIRTTRRDGWLIESGADSFITNRPGGLELCRELGLESQLIATNPEFRRSLICRDGKLHPTPAGFELMAPRQLGAILTTKLLSWPGKLRLLGEYLMPGAAPDDESVASFARRRFGREAFERIIQPMIGGIYAADPEKLSLAATLPRFLEMERQHGSLIRAFRHQSRQPNAAAEQASGARYGLFTTLRGGMQVLTDTLVQELKGVTLCLDSSIQSLRRNGEDWLLRTAAAEMPFDHVVFACPADHAATILSAGIEPPADIARAALIQELQGIEYSSTAVVITGHESSTIAHPLDAFGLIIPHVEGRRVMAVSFPSRKFPDRAPLGFVQLRTFVGGALQRELLDLDDKQLADLVETELRSLFGITAAPEFVQIARYLNAMPQYHLGHGARIARIKTLIAQIPHLHLTGNAYEGVGIPDVIQNAQATAANILRT